MHETVALASKRVYLETADVLRRAEGVARVRLRCGVRVLLPHFDGLVRLHRDEARARHIVRHGVDARLGLQAARLYQHVLRLMGRGTTRGEPSQLLT